MNQLLIFIVGLILGGVVAWFFTRRMLEKKDGADTGGLGEFNAEREKEREANKQKILQLLGERGRVANNSVQSLLSVSDATAERYLDELEKEGKIKQVGKVGNYVYYEKR